MEQPRHRTCKLCGRRCPDPQSEFCCPGCAAIHEIVCRLPVGDDEKRRRVEAMLAALFDQTATAAPSSCAEGKVTECCISGMVCPACAWIIHHCLSRLKGVTDVTINFLSETCTVSYDPMVVGMERIEKEVVRLGYGVREDKAPLGPSYLQFGLGWFYTLNVMMLSFIVYSAEHWEVPAAMAMLCSSILLVFTALTLGGAGRRSLRKGFQQLWRRQFRMESLIVLSASTALSYSLYSLMTGAFARLYFDVVCLLVMLLETGNLIENSFYLKIRGRILSLKQHLPKKLRVPDGRFVPLEDVVGGMRFAVATGEVVPTDGMATEDAEFDFSHITGESRAVRIKKGQFVGSGGNLLSKETVLTVPEQGPTSLIDRMIEGTISAFNTRRPVGALGDRVARFFVPLIIVLGAAVCLFFGWRGDWPAGILRMMAVFVVACPCAFGIAEPLVLTMAIDRIRTLGIQMFNGDVLRLKPDTIVFDKTGTFTRGNPAVVKIAWQIPENQESLDVLSSLEAGLDHPIARALSRLGRVLPLQDRRVEGTTVRGTYGGQVYQCGKPELYPGLGLYDDAVATLAAFGDERTCHLVAQLNDEIKPEVPQLIEELNRDYETHLCSGDRRPIVEAVGKRLAMRHQQWDMPTEKKQVYIRALQAEGHVVMMVGDGVNDAQALTAADVGLAVSAGEIPAKLSADGVFLASDMAGLLPLLRTLREIRRRIYQNYTWSFSYNAVGVWLAVAGFLSPTFCAFGMLFSNLVVTVNSVRRMKLGG